VAHDQPTTFDLLNILKKHQKSIKKLKCHGLVKMILKQLKDLERDPSALFTKVVFLCCLMIHCCQHRILFTMLQLCAFVVRRKVDGEYYVIKNVRIADMSYDEQISAINEVKLMSRKYG